MTRPLEPARRASVAMRPLLRAVAGHPALWPAALVEAVRLASPGWWRRWPPVPLPDERLWRFRMETAYGGAGDGSPEPDDVRSFVRWCGDMRRWRKL